MRLTVIMLLHLSRAASAAHADIFDRSAKARLLMAFEVIQRDEYIRIHYCATDVGFFYIFAIRNRHDNIVRTPQAVAYDDLEFCGDRIEAVQIRTMQYELQRIDPGLYTAHTADVHAGKLFGSVKIRDEPPRSTGRYSLFIDMLRDRKNDPLRGYHNVYL